jgi:hypothetical protein
LFEHRELKRHVFLFHRVKDGSFKGSGGQPYRYEGEYMVRQKYIIDSTGQDEKKRLAMRFILTPHDSIANPLWDEEYEWENARVPVYATGGQAVPTFMSGPDSKLKPLYTRSLKYSSPLLDSDDAEPALIGPPLYLQRHREMAHLDGFRVAVSDVKDMEKLFSHLCFAPGPWNSQKVAPVDIKTLLDKPFVPEPYPEKVEAVRQAGIVEMQVRETRLRPKYLLSSRVFFLSFTQRWYQEEGREVSPLTSKLKKYNIQQRTTRRLQTRLRQARQASGKSATRRAFVDSIDEDSESDAPMEVDGSGAIQIDDSVDGRRRRRRRPVDHGDVMVPIDSDEESSGGQKEEKSSEDVSGDEKDESFRSRKMFSKKVGRPPKKLSSSAAASAAGSGKKRGRPQKRKREESEETPRAAVAATASIKNDSDDEEEEESSKDKEEDKMDVSSSEDSAKSAEESKSVSQHIASHQKVTARAATPAPMKQSSILKSFMKAPAAFTKSPQSTSQQAAKPVQQTKLTQMFSAASSKHDVRPDEDSD